MRIQKAYLVESIPRGMDDLRETRGVEYTEKVLKRLTDRAEKTIDVTAMYWNLLPHVDGSDESGFSEKQSVSSVPNTAGPYTTHCVKRLTAVSSSG